MINRREFGAVAGAGILFPKNLASAESEPSRSHPFKPERVIITCLGSREKPACQMDAHLHDKACNVMMRPFIDRYVDRARSRIGITDMKFPKLSDMSKPPCEFKHVRMKLSNLFLGISSNQGGHVYSGNLDDFYTELFRMLRGESNWMTTHLSVVARNDTTLDVLLKNSGPETYWIDVNSLERSVPVRGTWGSRDLEASI